MKKYAIFKWFCVCLPVFVVILGTCWQQLPFTTSTHQHHKFHTNKHTYKRVCMYLRVNNTHGSLWLKFKQCNELACATNGACPAALNTYLHTYVCTRILFYTHMCSLSSSTTDMQVNINVSDKENTRKKIISIWEWMIRL